MRFRYVPLRARECVIRRNTLGVAPRFFPEPKSVHAFEFIRSDWTPALKQGPDVRDGRIHPRGPRPSLPILRRRRAMHGSPGRCPISGARGTLLTLRQIQSCGGVLSHTRTPVVAGWFTGEGDGFRLLGTRCPACASVFFPREDAGAPPPPADPLRSPPTPVRPRLRQGRRARISRRKMHVRDLLYGCAVIHPLTSADRRRPSCPLRTFQPSDQAT